MTTKKRSLTHKVLISSVLLVGFVWNAFWATWQSLMNNIDTSDIVSSISIEQSVETKDSSNWFISSLFWIQQASAWYTPDSSYSEEDLEIFQKLTDVRGTTFEKVILSAVKKWILKWYTEEKLFKPNKEVSYIEWLSIIYNSMDKVLEVPKYSSPSDSHWSKKYTKLYEAQDKTNLRSYSDSSSLHRDFAIYLMLRSIWIEFEASDYNKFEHTFWDVTYNSKFAPYLAFAWETGISKWYWDWTFWSALNKKISRGETAAFTSKILRMKTELQEHYEEKTGRTASVTYTKTTKIEDQKTNSSTSQSENSTVTPKVEIETPTVTTPVEVETPTVEIETPTVNWIYPDHVDFKVNPLLSNNDYSDWQKGWFTSKYPLTTAQWKSLVSNYAKFGIDITKSDPYAEFTTITWTYKASSSIMYWYKTMSNTNSKSNQYWLTNKIYQAFYWELEFNSTEYNTIKKALFETNSNWLGTALSWNIMDLEKIPGIDYSKAAKAQSWKDAYAMVKKALQKDGLSKYARFDDANLTISWLASWGRSFNNSNEKYTLKQAEYFSRGVSSYLFDR